jgi:MoxR-like ATPase
MTWGAYYRGDGEVHRDEFLPAPPWRRFPRTSIGAKFNPPKGLDLAVNAALSLRRPLLLTGAPGSGKSTVIESVARELGLGPVLRWNITSKSMLSDGLYSYDALGRIHDQQLKAAARAAGFGPVSMRGSTERPRLIEVELARVSARRRALEESVGDDIAPFLRLGPLGTALVPSERPRALLIDEIDKSDLDLPSDLLNVLERGEYEIPELVRYREQAAEVEVRTWDDEGTYETDTYQVKRGRVACTEFPFIVLTSNEERDFPPAFLRRCIRFTMPPPSPEELRAIVRDLVEIDVPESGPIADLVQGFAARLNDPGESVAVDQLLNAVFVLAGEPLPTEAQRGELTAILLRELTSG